QVERTRPPDPIKPAHEAADSGTAAESSASSVPVLEPPAPIHGADDPRRELEAFSAPGCIASTEAVEGAERHAREAVVPEPPAPFPTASEIVPAEAPREATALEPASFPAALSKEPAGLKPPPPFPTVSDTAPAEALSKDAAVPEPPAPFPTTKDVVSTESPAREPVHESPAPIEARDLSVPAPVVVPPVSRVSAPVPALEPR